MYQIRVQSQFHASHAVPLSDGQLEPQHWHLWKVEVVFEGDTLNSQGILVDFVDVQQRLKEILKPLSGVDLNQYPFFGGQPSSTEHLARRLYESLNAHSWTPARIVQVTVHEAPGCSASFLAP